MIQRTRTFGLALSLLLIGACTTDNEPSRIIEAESDETDDDDDSPPASPTSPSTSDPVAAMPDEPDASMPEPDVEDVIDAGVPDSGLSPLERLQAEIERIYKMRCPDQPEDLMMDRRAEPIPAWPRVASTPTRPQLTQKEAEEVYTTERTFAAGGVFTVSYSGGTIAPPEPGGDDALDAAVDGGAGAVLDASVGNEDETRTDAAADSGVSGPLGERSLEYASNDDWYPLNQIEDVNKIVPGLVVDPDGNGTNTTIQSAISDAVVVEGCPRVFIKVMPGTYREKITVPAKTSSPPVTLYGADLDASRVVIVHGHSAAGDADMGIQLTIHASATFTNSLPRLFQARNLTIANDYVAGTWPGDEDMQTAVALLNQGDRAEFDNVRVIGHRHSLYVKSTAPNEVARAYFSNCYVEGDEDILLGRGSGVFDQCTFHSVGDRVSGGAIAAPSTRVENPYGFLFINSRFTADEGVEDVYLGRSWYEGEEMEAVGKTIFRNSILGAHIRREDPWAAVERETAKDPSGTQPVILYNSDDYYPHNGGLSPPEIFLAEYGNSGPGAAQ